jgi:hypothetical protein
MTKKSKPDVAVADSDLEKRVTALEERLVVVEEQNQASGQLLAQIMAAATRPQAPIDPQLAFINARVSAERAQKTAAPVNLGAAMPPQFDAQSARINAKRTELLGGRK